MNSSEQTNGYLQTNDSMNFDLNKSEGPRKILVVDDHVTNFSIIEGFLMCMGYKNSKQNLLYAYNGFEALKILEKAIDERDATRFSLILVECKMPLIDGFETIRRIGWLFDGIGLPKKYRPKIVATTCVTEVQY